VKSERDLTGMASTHEVFVASGLPMAPTDRFSAGHHEREGQLPGV